MATNGLNKITEKILAAAKDQANGILADAQTDCARILADYDERAEQIRLANAHETERKTADLIARATSSAAMAGRNLVGEARSNLIETVFQSAFEEIENKPQTDYAELVIGLLCAAAEELFATEEKNLALYGAEEEEVADTCEILLNADDKERIGKMVLDGVCKKLKGKISDENLKKITLAEDTVRIKGGAVLRYGEVESNCSLEMLFSMLRRELETDVSRILFAAENL